MESPAILFVGRFRTALRDLLPYAYEIWKYED